MAKKIVDLVEQTSTTTGTGAYTMTGSVTGRRTFASALAASDVVPYAAVDDAGGYEIGFGTWSGTTLARTVVVASSNANAAVNWAAGTRRIYVTAHAASTPQAALRHNIGTTSSLPTVSDDSAAGYGRGSCWITTTGVQLVCVDPTAGAAVWRMVPSSDDGTDGLPAGALNGYLDMTARGRFTPQSAAGVMVGGTSASRGDPGFYPTSGVPLGYSWYGAAGAHTSDATPFAMISMDEELNPVTIQVPGNGTYILRAMVTATAGGAFGDRKAWEVSVGIAVVGGVATVGTGVKTDMVATAGAASWDVDLDYDATAGLRILCTGAAATEIDWHATFLTSNLAAE